MTATASRESLLEAISPRQQAEAAYSAAKAALGELWAAIQATSPEPSPRELGAVYEASRRLALARVRMYRGLGKFPQPRSAPASHRGEALAPAPLARHRGTRVA